MAKVLTVGCDLKRLLEVNGMLRSHGHSVRTAHCRSTMRHLLALEPFQFIAIIDPLPSLFADALLKELHAGRVCPRLLHAEGFRAEDLTKLLAGEQALRSTAA